MVQLNFGSKPVLLEIFLACVIRYLIFTNLSFELLVCLDHCGFQEKLISKNTKFHISFVGIDFGGKHSLDDAFGASLSEWGIRANEIPF